MLYHFSDKPDIDQFVPKASRLGRPVVWAITAEYAFLYLFPRDCPRILLWATAETTQPDRYRWLGPTTRVAYVERAWIDRIANTDLYRYNLPEAPFDALDEVGMHGSEETVTPNSVIAISDLPQRLVAENVELRPVASLKPLTSLWDSSLHVSGIRMRNMQD